MPTTVIEECRFHFCDMRGVERAQILEEIMTLHLAVRNTAPQKPSVVYANASHRHLSRKPKL